MIAKRELKLVQEKERLTKEIEVVGLWMNRDQLLIDEENPPDENDVPVPLPQCHEDILTQPELLVGQRIRHQFEVDGNLLWYEGIQF